MSRTGTGVSRLVCLSAWRIFYPQFPGERVEHPPAGSRSQASKMIPVERSSSARPTQLT